MNKSIDMNKKVIRNPRAICTEEEDAVLISCLSIEEDEEDMSVFANKIGYAVWNLCDGQYSCAEIVGMFQEKFPGIPAETIAADVSNFVNSMIECSLLTLAEENCLV